MNSWTRLITIAVAAGVVGGAALGAAAYAAGTSAISRTTGTGSATTQFVSGASPSGLAVLPGDASGADLQVQPADGSLAVTPTQTPATGSAQPNATVGTDAESGVNEPSEAAEAPDADDPAGGEASEAAEAPDADDTPGASEAPEASEAPDANDVAGTDEGSND